PTAGPGYVGLVSKNLRRSLTGRRSCSENLPKACNRLRHSVVGMAPRVGSTVHGSNTSNGRVASVGFVSAGRPATGPDQRALAFAARRRALVGGRITSAVLRGGRLCSGQGFPARPPRRRSTDGASD